MDWPISSDGRTRALDSSAETVGARAFIAGRSDHPEPLEIIITESGMKAARRDPARPSLRGSVRLLWAAATVLLVGGSIGWFELRPKHVSAPQRLPAAVPITLPPPDLLRPITSQEATRENAERPFVDRPDSPAAKFILRTDAQDHDRAVKCLTQAVYYEAAGEGADGQRAVAQVVLNRVHHPGYPSTVCGVVYQGGERLTGCQFTFVCDGSLQRIPSVTPWARSRKIAEEALAGKVFAPVGHATHYHADYVLPYWADVLDKSVQIGRHIFYRLRGPIGDARGFSQHYAGSEPNLPKREIPTVLPATDATAALATALASDAVTAAPDVEKAAAPSSPLAADASKGALIADGGTVATGVASPKPKNLAGCSAGADRAKLTPLGANDMHSGNDESSC